MVDKTIATPLYTQVADTLRREILNKRYGDRGCIGTHTQLAQRFNVSLRTIRSAAQQLEQEGLVEIHQGKGTFVRSTMLVDRLQNLTGLSNLLAGTDVEKKVTVPAFRVESTPVWLDDDIRRALGPTCLFIRRVMEVEGVLTSVADMYLPGKYIGDFSQTEVEETTVYQIYQKKLGVELGRGRQTIQAAGAAGEQARSLGLAENAPVLQLKRRAYDTQQNLIEYMILSYRPECYCFEVEMDLYKNI